MGLQSNCDARTNAVDPNIEEQEAIDTMRLAVANALHKDCALIVIEMAKKAAEGDTRSARFLCDLANERKELTTVQQKRVKRSLATEWANEPEWDPNLEERLPNLAQKNNPTE